MKNLTKTFYKTYIELGNKNLVMEIIWSQKNVWVIYESVH